MSKTVLFVVALVLVLLTGVGGGGWYYLSTQKDFVKNESSKQAESLGKVNERIQAVTTIYQQLGEQKSEQPVRVLGAQTPANNRQQDILQKSQQVLGIEDSETLQKSRDIIEIITQSEEELKKLNSGLDRISSIGGLSLFFRKSIMWNYLLIKLRNFMLGLPQFSKPSNPPSRSVLKLTKQAMISAPPSQLRSNALTKTPSKN